MASCLRQMRRDAVHRDAASKETDRAPRALPPSSSA
jgi:hypothetical protein